MSNRVKLSDLRFLSQNSLFPKDLESQRKIVKRFLNLSITDEHIFSLSIEWFGKHSTNKGNKKKLLDELEQQIEFEKQIIEMEATEQSENKGHVLRMVSELYEILKHFLKMKRKYYRLTRALFLETLTVKYVSIRHKVRKRNLYHEPKIYAKRKPLIPASQSVSHKYRPSDIKVDFVFKKMDEEAGLFLYECKASLANFFKAIDENDERAKSALRKIDYILAVRNAFSSKVFNSNSYKFLAVMTTYVDCPDYLENDFLGFPKIIKPIRADKIGSVLFSSKIAV